jgi:hypothetical protein
MNNRPLILIVICFSCLICCREPDSLVKTNREHLGIDLEELAREMAEAPPLKNL